NFRRSKRFQCGALISVKKTKRAWMIGNLIKELIEWVKSFNTNTIVLEDLKFKNTLDTNRKFNRLRSNFTYKRMKENIVTKCLRENISLIFVNPAYTSIIGNLKYQKRFGVNEHQAAAYVIAKKGMGFEEKVPRTLRPFVSSSEKKSLGFWKKLWNITKLMERRGCIERFQNHKERVPNRESPLIHSGRRVLEREVELRENRSSTGEIVKSGIG
ncbi:MAG: IS200/IS605 family accessory protein TnpB-related protein, partial [Promethearchaeota archaeon]